METLAASESLAALGHETRLAIFRALVQPVSELNRLRREAAAALDRLRAAPRRWQSQAYERPRFGTSAGDPGAPELIAVIRLPEQLDAAWSAGARTLYCEFENPKFYRDAGSSEYPWSLRKL